MDLKNDEFAKQLIAEFLDAQQQALAVLATAVGDVVGAQALSQALDNRLARSAAANVHPIRDRLLATAARALRGDR